MTILYQYIGHGETLANVPARDITESDIEERAELWLAHGISEAVLLASGLYQKAEHPAPKKQAGKDGK